MPRNASEHYWAKGKWKSLSCVQLFATPWTVQSTEFSRPEYWSEVSFPFSRGLSQPRDQTQVFRIAGGFFTNWATREEWAKVNLGTNTRFNISIFPLLQGALEHWVDCHKCNQLSSNCSLLESLLMPTNLAIMS